MSGAEGAQLHQLRFSAACIDREHACDDLGEQALEVCDFNFAIIVVIREAQNQVDFTGRESELLGVADDLADVLDGHPAVLIDFETGTSEKVIADFLNVDVHDAAASQIVAHLIEIAREVAILDLVVTEFHHVVSQQQVDLFDVQVASVMENFAHLIESNLARMLLGISISVESLEAPLEDESDLLDLGIEDKLERLFIDFLRLGGLLSEHLVSRKERLDSIDADGDEVCPGDIADVVLVSEGEEDADVVLAQVIGGQQLERIVELHVRQLPTLRHVRLRKQQSQSALKRLNEAGRLNVDLLRLVQLFREVLSFHDVKFGHEWIDRLSLLVDIARVFKLGSQMEQLLDLVLVFQHAVDPTLDKINT